MECLYVYFEGSDKKYSTDGALLKKKREKEFSDYVSELLVKCLGRGKYKVGIKDVQPGYFKDGFPLSMHGTFVQTFSKQEVDEAIGKFTLGENRDLLRSKLERLTKDEKFSNKVLAKDAFKLMFTFPLKEFNY